MVMALMVVEHPLLKAKITKLRDIRTGSKEFRELVSELTLLLLYEATRKLPLTEVSVTTPLAKTMGYSIDGEVLFVPILRAGLAMLEGALKLIPNAKVAHLGVYRDHDTLKPVLYFSKFPSNIQGMNIFVLDPMLATGGSVAFAIEHIKQRGGDNLSVLSLIAAPEGVDTVLSHHPDVDIYVAAMDERLDDRGYIIPGLGDAGDRLYGTK